MRVSLRYNVINERGEDLKTEIRIEDGCTETKIIIVTNKMTEEINRIIKLLSEDNPQIITGVRDDVTEILEQSEIIRIYAASGKVYAVSEKGEYTLRKRLYELEELLDKSCFVRISNSEIINLKKAKSFDLSAAGTICVLLSSGGIAYVSRRYVSKIKRLLGM